MIWIEERMVHLPKPFPHTYMLDKIYLKNPQRCQVQTDVSLN